MKIQVIAAPYDSGIRDHRMGLGPRRLLEAGLEDRLRYAQHTVTSEVLDIASDDPTNELDFVGTLGSALSERVSAAREAASFPIILSGSCYASLGIVAGLGPTRTGVFWFDSHGDLHTPDTSSSGFLDGMAIGALTGACWHEETGRIPDFSAIPERNVYLLGARDLDPPESDLLAESPITLFRPDDVRANLRSTIERMRPGFHVAHLHIDLDVLDPSEGRANEMAASDGLSLAEMVEAVRAIGETIPVAAAAFTAYDPAFDGDGKVCQAAFALIDTVLEVAGKWI